MSNSFPTIQNAQKLLDFLELKANSPIEPSPDVMTFLERIDSADPNSSEFSEDEMNENWGHHQFTAGGLRCATVLTSWDKIGVSTACNLVAAAIKTCQIARHICFEHEVDARSFLSDAYLQTLIDTLWAAKEKTYPAIQTAQTTSINDGDSSLAGPNTSDFIPEGEAKHGQANFQVCHHLPLVHFQV